MRERRRIAGIWILAHHSQRLRAVRHPTPRQRRRVVASVGGVLLRDRLIGLQRRAGHLERLRDDVSGARLLEQLGDVEAAAHRGKRPTRAAVSVSDIDIGPVLQEQAHDLEMTRLRRLDQGRPSVVVLRVNPCAAIEQHLDDLDAVIARGAHQRHDVAFGAVHVHAVRKNRSHDG